MNKPVEEFIMFLNNLGFWGDEEFDDENEMELALDFGEIKVKIYHDDEIYDIYMDLPYYDVNQKFYESFNGDFDYDEEGISDNLMQDITKYWLSKELNCGFRKMPVEEYDLHYMCPGSNLYLGYFGNKIYDSTVDIKLFIKICKDFAPSCFKDKRGIYHVISETIIDYLTMCGYEKSDTKVLRKNTEQIIIAPIDEPLDKYVDKKDLVIVDELYYGKEYLLFRAENNVNCINIESLTDYENLVNIFGWGKDTEYFTDNQNYFYFSNSLIHGFAKLNPQPPIYQDLEYMYILVSFDKFKNFRTNSNIELLDFSHLTPNQFENLCYEFLVADGYQNIHPIGNTTAADGGKDLIANEIINSKIGTEKRAYVIQCKHSKTSLPREAINEIDTLLRENNAEKYLLICSNDLSPQVIQRLETQNEKRTNKVSYWSKVEFSTQLNKYPEIIVKFKLLGEKNIKYANPYFMRGDTHAIL